MPMDMSQTWVGVWSGILAETLAFPANDLLKFMDNNVYIM